MNNANLVKIRPLSFIDDESYEDGAVFRSTAIVDSWAGKDDVEDETTRYYYRFDVFHNGDKYYAMSASLDKGRTLVGSLKEGKDLCNFWWRTHCEQMLDYLKRCVIDEE